MEVGTGGQCKVSRRERAAGVPAVRCRLLSICIRTLLQKLFFVETSMADRTGRKFFVWCLEHSKQSVNISVLSPSISSSCF